MKKQIAKDLLSIEAVTLSVEHPYTWSSGMKSPIYCDNRLTLSYPNVRNEIAEGLKNLVLEHFPETNMIAGTATAGIPHAALLADRLDLPMSYVRSSAKSHGKGKQIEGKAEAGMNVVVVEDLVSTGGSVITAVQALREAGCNVLGVVAVFSYELAKGADNLAANNINVQTLTDFSTLIETASVEGYISKDDLSYLLSWKENPENWLQNA
ncbi:orotate phosphoribosyltransferase [Fictibacillus sp. WQ 8-8]|uniref:orotate phosphoribosyltransferase n=1 Tax=unclassified Fictibacillus TaxID=2644029 RepID=UPI00210CDA10|nr:MULTISPECIES: orotate phosphoribosyltransferase [unclassified Fictibacillus]MCQ6265731.1 orotate phosphoribosyltransferase [Fictibacillus sp. WQ 8-8]MED2973387.1 orotate phosphoribosyltransferase [Fictibacillus sp. B-59209]